MSSVFTPAWPDSSDSMRVCSVVRSSLSITGGSGPLTSLRACSREMVKLS
ncbi:Uncharacterised protein [Mycobacterium tuberculosis]|nr:Uncharacterised protein [Mycobacterium tuberculosis]